MPASQTSFAAATVALATEKRNSKIKPSLIMVDNNLGGVDAVITINDVFTPSVTNGVPIPVLTTVPRLHFTVPTSVSTTIGENGELDDVEFLGAVQAVRGILDAGCFISFGYHLD